LTYDEYGGFYDNIAPPETAAYQLDGNGTGDGFRVPLIVISPWVKNGIFYGPKSDQPQDMSSLLYTIESLFGLKSIGTRTSPAADSTLWYMFNFNRKPIQPLYTVYGQMIVYPVTKCVAENLCSRTTPFPPPPASSQGRIAPNYPYPPADSDGDPYD
jgi:hypothetical protein